MTTLDRSRCEQLDRDDPLAGARSLFSLPTGVIYLDGNSMGAMPLAMPERLSTLVEGQWAPHLVTGWTRDGWMDAPRRVGAKLAHLIGAAPDEVVIADSTTVNLFKLLATALVLRPERHVILTERQNFPTDIYVAQGLAQLLGDRVQLRLVERSDLAHALTDDVAVLVLTEVDYRTGLLHDMASWTAKAHSAGALALWDLCHSAGALPVALNACMVDLAVGCGYKYLNAGPGAPAFLFVAQRHQAAAVNPISGWLGHAAPFDFDQEYQPAPGIGRMISGSPSVLSLAALECSLDLLSGIDMAAVRQKSLGLSSLFIELVENRLEGYGLTLLTPGDARQRGSQVSWRHDCAYGIIQALIRRGVIGDFRAPDVCRFGMTPLYLGYVDIWDAVEHMAQVLAGQEHLDPEFAQIAAIT